MRKVLKILTGIIALILVVSIIGNIGRSLEGENATSEEVDPVEVEENETVEEETAVEVATDEDDTEDNEPVEENGSTLIEIEIREDVGTYAEDYNSTSVREIKVNEDLGTGEGYIVLVDLSFDAQNTTGTSKEMIDMYSQDLGARLANNKNVNEVTVFWEVPYLQESGNIAKYNMQRQGDGMAIMEEWFDHNIFE